MGKSSGYPIDTRGTKKDCTPIRIIEANLNMGEYKQDLAVISEIRCYFFRDSDKNPLLLDNYWLVKGQEINDQINSEMENVKGIKRGTLSRDQI